MSNASENTGASITTLASREVYRNHWLRVREDRILRTNGVEGIYSVVDKDDCAIILPIDNGRVWLVEQFRYTIQERALELPQGGWEMDAVDAEEMARGELREETGLHAEQMTRLGALWIAYGFARQKQHVYLATGLTQADTDRDPEEHDLAVHSVTVEEFEKMMLDGKITDLSTVGAWGLYLLWQRQGAENKGLGTRE
jgi:8-oxo-dGTP pyrophosphatase MutT (NUDIX family)